MRKLNQPTIAEDNSCGSTKTSRGLHVEKLFGLLTDLDRRRIHYELRRVRNESIMIDVAVPGQRWEVELMAASR